MKTRIQQIRERLEAATPGPWYPGFAWPNAIYKNKALTKQLGTVGKNSHINDENGKIDAEFIANAPQDIADLLAVVEVLEAGLEQYEQPFDTIITDPRHPRFIDIDRGLTAREALTKAHEIFSSSES